jgi:signal transduction histidine kinase
VVTADGPEAAALQVKMDESKLRQVLLNLLENARQAMPEGGRLSLGCARDSRAGVRIQVADTGGGIPPENLDRVFDAFFSTKSAGTGLGLAIVKQTVEAAGGRILVDSQVGKGTRFEISLPLAVTAGAASGDSGGPTGPPPAEDGAS